MENFINFILPVMEHFRILGYWIVFLISLIETLAFIGIIIPGTTFLILVGFLSAHGVLDFGDLVWFAALGAIIGDSFSFYLGKKGIKLFKWESRFFKQAYLERGEKFFNKHGHKSIFLGRFVGPLRPIIPFVAGLFKMKNKPFIFWDIVSSFAWAVAFLFLGYFFGQAWQTIAAWSTRAGIFVIALLLFLIIFYFLKWFIIKRGRQFFAFLRSLGISLKQALLENPEVRKLLKKHRRFFAFLKARLRRDKFSGLPLSLLVLIFLYAFFTFGDSGGYFKR